MPAPSHTYTRVCVNDEKSRYSIAKIENILQWEARKVDKTKKKQVQRKQKKLA